MTGEPTGFQIAVVTGIGVVIDPWIAVIARLKDGIPGTTGIPAMWGAEIGARIVRLIVRQTGRSIVRRSGRAVVAAVVDIASRAVETAVAAGISGTTVTSVRKAAGEAVVVADIASIKEVVAVVTTSSGTRTMEVAVVVARTSPGSSLRPRRNRWCRRSP